MEVRSAAGLSISYRCISLSSGVSCGRTGRTGLCVLCAQRKLEEDLGVLLLMVLLWKKQISKEVSFVLAVATSEGTNNFSGSVYTGKLSSLLPVRFLIWTLVLKYL